MKGWLGFLGILMIRGGVMAIAGWVVVQMVKDVWGFSVVLGLLVGLMLILGVGLLYTILERWP